MSGLNPLRSVLYVPGDNERAMTKSAGLTVDAIIYDLEDAVAPANKQAARARVCRAVTTRDQDQHVIAIRINDLASNEGAEDLQAVLGAAPDVLVLPKVQTAQDIEHLHARIKSSGDQGMDRALEIWAMIETPSAILNIKEIAERSRIQGYRLGALVLGTNDLAKLTGVRLDMMASWLMDCVLVAKAYGLPIIDGVFNNYSDQEGFAAACEQGRDMGFDGKTLIHPSQIASANQVFAPSKVQLQEACEVVALFEREGHENMNVLELDGRMVERLHYLMAKKTLKIAQMIKEQTA
ncbi:MAG: CoA ester lyase [bacterium]|nr:CoA ester lyase [bacterium]